MSHYTQLSIKAQQKYETELVAALKQHFGENGVEYSAASKIPLKHWDGRTSKLKAEIVVRKNTLGRKAGHEVLCNDLGYERDNEGGYTVHADIAGFPLNDQNLISKYYAEKVTAKKMKARGYNIAERAQLEDGRIELTLRRYA